MVADAEKTVLASVSRKDGTYLDMGEFLSFENAKKNTIRMGDFFDDGYVDVAYIDSIGVLRVVSHTAALSEEIEIISDKNRTLGTIAQMEVFDMDHDGKDDIIVMDNL